MPSASVLAAPSSGTLLFLPQREQQPRARELWDLLAFASGRGRGAARAAGTGGRGRAVPAFPAAEPAPVLRVRAGGRRAAPALRSVVSHLGVVFM